MNTYLLSMETIHHPETRKVLIDVGDCWTVTAFAAWADKHGIDNVKMTVVRAESSTDAFRKILGS